MKYITILILVFLSLELEAQSDKLVIDSKNYISTLLKIYEPNPIHKDNSEKIVKIFQTKLTGYPDNKLDTSLLLRLLIDNSETKYEDSQDVYRYAIRRCMIFSLVAMSVEPDKADLFLDLAENSLLISENRIDETLNDSYAGFLILKLLIKDSNKSMTLIDLQQVSDKFKKLESRIDQKIYDTGYSIIGIYNQKLSK
jgi:hypothetical protein